VVFEQSSSMQVAFEVSVVTFCIMHEMVQRKGKKKKATHLKL